MYDEKTIKDMIACGESSAVQFKQEFTTQTKMAEEMVAFANGRGGTILIGVVDKTGEIKGLDYDEIRKANTDLSNTANEYVRPTIYLQTEPVKVNGKHILAVTIEEGTAKPYKDLAGHIWVKQGADKRRVTENSQLLRLFATSKVYNPDEDGVSGTSADDLNDKLIDDYLQRVHGKKHTDFDMPYQTLLENLRIMNEDGRLTLAGLLYFGKNPQQFKPAFNIKAVAFYGNDMGGTEYRDSKDLEGTIPELFEQAMRFLDMNLHHIQAGQSFNSLGILEVSKVALEEILQNALVHREYIKQAPIRLLIFDNRVEIISPGSLPDGLTVERIKMGNTSQRNMLVATFCARTMLYRGLGSGIIRVIKEGTSIDFLNDEDGNQFKAILWRIPSKSENTTGNTPSKEGESPNNIENTPSSTPSITPSKNELRKAKVLKFCAEPHTLKEIAEYLGIADRKRVKKDYINPLLGVSLRMTQPDSPKSPTQRYVVIK